MQGGTPPDELLTKDEAAARLKVVPRTLTKWQRKGLPFIKIGGRVLFPWPEVREALKRNHGFNL
jgi:excisionase family DNA binding protein